MKVGITQFAAALREIRTEEFVPARLNAVLETLELTQTSVGQHVQWRPGGYTRNLVYANSDFELLVLCWDAGAISSIHDHAGQQCWFVTHSGFFTVENYDLISGGREAGHALVKATTTDINVTVGMPDYRAPDSSEIHRVSVPQHSVRAISIHVYAKPISRCLIFDESTQRCIEKPLTYDNVTSKQVFVA